MLATIVAQSGEGAVKKSFCESHELTQLGWRRRSLSCCRGYGQLLACCAGTTTTTGTTTATTMTIMVFPIKVKHQCLSTWDHSALLILETRCTYCWPGFFTPPLLQSYAPLPPFSSHCTGHVWHGWRQFAALG